MDQADHDRLTERERACLRLLDADHNQDDVAALLEISVETVRTHLKNARAKLGGRATRVLARELRHFEGGHQRPGNRWQVIPIAWIDALPTALRRGGFDGSMPALLRAKGEQGNDLNILQRIGAVVAIAIILAIAFGMLAVGIRVISELVGPAR